jgi:hypothetical protein
MILSNEAARNRNEQLYKERDDLGLILQKIEYLVQISQKTNKKKYVLDRTYFRQNFKPISIIIPGSL